MPTPEEWARNSIDHKLGTAGWVEQDYRSANLATALGVAAREFPTDNRPADYVLFIDHLAVGLIEVRMEGTSLRGNTEQPACFRA